MHRSYGSGAGVGGIGGVGIAAVVVAGTLFDGLPMLLRTGVGARLTDSTVDGPRSRVGAWLGGCDKPR
jgi:hypothetical protein